MKLEYEGILLRNAEESDCAQLAAWWNDGAVMAHAGFPLGLGTTPEKIAAQIAADSDGTRRRLILEYLEKPIGEMSFRILQDGAAEIGIKICDAAAYPFKNLRSPKFLRQLKLLTNFRGEKSC